MTSPLPSMTWRPYWPAAPHLDPDRLAEPIGAEPTLVSVEPHGDLFRDYTSGQIAAVFGVMAACPQHRFVVRIGVTSLRGSDDWFAWVAAQPADIGTVLGRAADDVLFSDDGELACDIANYVNGWSRWADIPDDGNPCNGSVRRWPLPNVRIEVVL